jgi:glycerophosphoryl diester phosphodiesterase
MQQYSCVGYSDQLLHVSLTLKTEYPLDVRKLVCLPAVLTLAVAALAAERPTTVKEFMDLDSPTRVIAHRGFSAEAPENTLAAIRAAIEVGADMVEIDVTMTADGFAIGLHDEKLDRTTTGKGLPTEWTLAELRKLDAGSWFSPDFSDERIPTLTEELEAVKERILINVEIKPEAVEHGVVERVAKLIADQEMHDQVVVSSFSPEALLRIRGVDPAVVTVSLFNKELHTGRDPLEIVTEVGSRGLNISHKRVTPELIERCHRHGIPVGVYTVNDQPDMRRMIDMGVHSIFTDHPDRLLEVLAENHERAIASNGM